MSTLSELQRRTLRSLATFEAIAPVEQWQMANRYNGNTLTALERRGCVETREYVGRVIRGWEVRITAKGKEALGDEHP